VKSNPRLGSGLFAALLLSARGRSAFLGGVNGLLPCGLVCAYLALAVSFGDLWHDMATMARFGLGTLPILILVDCGRTVRSLTCRCRVLRLAAWCVVLTGVVSSVRGLGFLNAPEFLEVARHPWCR
jgi:sulfite exporter TauE/SafE